MHGGYVLPQNVPANEFLNLEGRKISTSRNWAVWLHEYIERWPHRQDELRYCLATIIPEQKDSEFTWKDFQEKNNSELVSIIGNFVQRVMVLCHKFYEGKAPAPGTATPDDLTLWSAVHGNAGGGGTCHRCVPFARCLERGDERGAGRQQVPQR
jgi:methionyl-tRNA synthetase